MSKNWMADFLKEFVGRKIVEIRPLTAAENDSMYWHASPGDTVLIVFDDGSWWLPMQDPEGNGPGFIEIGAADAA